MQETAGQPAGEATLTGEVKAIVFRNPTSGYTVAALKCPQGEVRVTGHLATVRAGGRYVFYGDWVCHPKYGQQFAAGALEEIVPAEEEGIVGYLASGLIPGVGERLARRLVEHFGTDTLKVISEEPARLVQVPGVGKKLAGKIARSVNEHKDVERLMVFLRHHHVSTSLALKIHRRYGREAIARLKDNPYALTDDIFGVGFLTADRLACELGLRRHAPERLTAAALYALRQAATRAGHCYLPAQELVAETLKLVNAPGEEEPVEEDEVQAALAGLSQRSPEVVVEGDRFWLPYLYQAERGVARELQRLLKAERRVPPAKLEAAIRRAAAELGLTFAPAQELALRQGVLQGVTVLTGGPGTGKSTIVSGLIRVLSELEPGVRILLAAPTGRAAQRLTDLTGCEASTIHRLLGYTLAEGEPTFTYNSENQLKADLIIVDEFSMVDVLLAYQLFQAVPTACRLVLVGDKDQLPSVGAGSVLRDIIASDLVPTVRLTQIFRQAEQSLITVNAHRINQGQGLVLKPASDFYFLRSEDPEETVRTVLDLAGRMVGTFGLENVQVLAPMHKYVTGVQNLNKLLQEKLNPAAPGKKEYPFRDGFFRTGDKVMAVRNNYDKGVFNGNQGRVVDVILAREDEDVEEDTLLVDFDGLLVPYGRSELDELTLAYAATVHKAQGSEFSCCIFVLSTQHWYMLQRNLLYTGVTRGKELVMLVGSRRALVRAVANSTVQERYTALDERLRGAGVAQ
ncbi:MAG TPA: ATP-dependent RecD-like DNA helicase [Firmicutes bacterium]|nr:ATP-dependent RecD-like DNA helicase [Bacillota bacterium]